MTWTSWPCITLLPGQATTVQGQAGGEMGRWSREGTWLLGIDEPKEAADIRRAEEPSRHRGRLSTQKTGQCWRNRRKIGKHKGDREFKSNKLVKSLTGTILALRKPAVLGVVQTYKADDAAHVPVKWQSAFNSDTHTWVWKVPSAIW